VNNRAREQRYRHIVESIDRLPALPAIVTKLIEVVNSPESSADDAAALIEKDPALTSKMLRLANSAFYGIPRTISSVSSAVVILGFNTIRSVALSASIMNLFPEKKTGHTFDHHCFWRHSVVCASTAKSIARKHIHRLMLDPEGAFCTGILHDIGKLIFASFAPDDYQHACEMSLHQKLSLLKAERETLGIDHSAIGRMLADRWALPIELENSLVHHHDPAQARQARELVTLVHLADKFAHHVGATSLEGEPAGSWRDDAMQELGFGAEDDESFCQCAREGLEKSAEFLAIIGES
jgi:HD-like signal output (HDOD) protein